ncbi:MAG: hypothetical protein ACYC92_13590 [Candidatus Acidiferrales bacterium]
MTRDENSSRMEETSARKSAAIGRAMLERVAHEIAALEDSASKRPMSELAASKSTARESAASAHTTLENAMADHAVVKMIELLDSGILEPGIFGEIVILHGDGCARIEGKGICQCDPDLQLLPPQNKRAKRARKNARAKVQVGKPFFAGAGFCRRGSSDARGRG